MLEKMFPRNGEIVPEVRFAEFTGNWEKRKLGEIADKAVEVKTAPLSIPATPSTLGLTKRI